MNKFLKILILIICWLTLSPVMLVLSNRWKMMPKWLSVFLMMVSPLFLILYLFIACKNIDYFYKYNWIRPFIIKNITEVKMPRFKVVECRSVWMRMGYVDVFDLEFKKMPSDDFYRELDKHFKKHDNIYYFSIPYDKKYKMTGKPESAWVDFSIEIEKGSKKFIVRSYRPYGLLKCVE